MVHPDRRRPERVVESTVRSAERSVWQPSRIPPAQEPAASVADLRRVPLPASPEAAPRAGFLR